MGKSIKNTGIITYVHQSDISAGIQHFIPERLRYSQRTTS